MNVVAKLIMIMNIEIVVTRVFLIIISTIENIHLNINDFSLCCFIDTYSEK